MQHFKHIFKYKDVHKSKYNVDAPCILLGILPHVKYPHQAQSLPPKTILAEMQKKESKEKAVKTPK